MLRRAITQQDVCDLLNDMLATDPAAVEALISTRVPINDVLAKHPTIQCTSVLQLAGKDLKIECVGLLGVLNGLFGTFENNANVFNGFGAIVMRSDPKDQPSIKEFVTLESYAEGLVDYNDQIEGGGPLAKEGEVVEIGSGPTDLSAPGAVAVGVNKETKEEKIRVETVPLEGPGSVDE